MADRTWDNGAGTRVVATAANWSADTAPVSNDRVFFTSENTSANTGPNTTMTGLTAVDADLIQVQSGYTEAIGTNGDPFKISADKVEHYGPNTLYYLDGDGTTDHILVDVSRTISTGQLSLELSGATTTLLSCVRGYTSVLASSTITTMHVGQLGLATPETKLIVATGCTLTASRAFGGTTTCSSNPTTLEVFAGATWTQNTAAITTVYVFPGARLNLAFTGTYTTVYHYGGIIDATAGGPMTFTNYYKGFQNEDAQNVILGSYKVTRTNNL